MQMKGGEEEGGMDLKEKGKKERGVKKERRVLSASTRRRGGKQRRVLRAVDAHGCAYERCLSHKNYTGSPLSEREKATEGGVSERVGV